MRRYPPDGHARQLLEEHIGQIELLPCSNDEPWGVSIAHRSGSTTLRGVAAKQLLSQLLATLNCRGASRRQLDEAVVLISDEGGTNEYTAWAIAAREARRRAGEVFVNPDLGPLGLTFTERLALEMALNEDLERPALEGEFAQLLVAWRDAEDLARIAESALASGEWDGRH